MKTAREWFEELPEPYRSQAMDNLQWDDPCETLAGAIFEGFTWRETPQGGEHWLDLWGELAASEPLEPQLDPQPDLAQLVREYFEAKDSMPQADLDNAEKALRKAVGLE